MARWQPPIFVGDPTDPDSLSVLLEAWLTDLAVRNYAKSTIYSRKRDLIVFLMWCEDRSLARASEITRPMLDTYQQFIFNYRKKEDEQPLTFLAQRQRLESVKLFFQWLAKKKFLVNNPASELELPRIEKRLPKHVLTAREADLVLTSPDVSDALGVRDRAILEVLYSTGMRRAELSHLEIFDVDADRGTVLIRQGKGRKDRIVPIGERACRWLAKYVADVRPLLATPASGAALFLTHLGAAIRPELMTTIVRSYIEAAGIQKEGACHLFRHAMATLMLENGADIRFIQQMLGHASLETTEIYTHVSIRKLKEIHSATHPSARIPPARSEDEAVPVTAAAPEAQSGDGRINRRRNELNRLFTPTSESELMK